MSVYFALLQILENGLVRELHVPRISADQKNPQFESYRNDGIANALGMSRSQRRGDPCIGITGLERPLSVKVGKVCILVDIQSETIEQVFAQIPLSVVYLDREPVEALSPFWSKSEQAWLSISDAIS